VILSRPLRRHELGNGECDLQGRCGEWQWAATSATSERCSCRHVLARTASAQRDDTRRKEAALVETHLLVENAFG